jgi:hypothetical protein
MTSEKWAKLTPEQKKIKVAELCGCMWMYEPDSFNHDHTLYPETGVLIWKPPQDGPSAASLGASGYGYLPEYLHDLNAMHEVENAQVNFSNILNYHCNLLEVIIRDKDHDPNRKWPMSICIGAKAAQRAEAFVLTMEPE